MFPPANTPGTIEHWMLNEHYPTGRGVRETIADAMHEEYKAIVDAGFILKQIDDPDLPDGWNCLHLEITVPEYRSIRNDPGRRAEPRVAGHLLGRKSACMFAGAAITVRITYDIPLRDIIDLIFLRQLCGRSFSIEASNPCA